MLETSQMNHPLKVYHPGRGTVHVCRWWTHNEQYQLIVAPNEMSVQHIWKTAYQWYRDARAEELCEVELVAPSKLMCEEAIKYEYAQAVKEFIDQVTGRLREVIELGFPLPTQFVPCPVWQNKDEDDEDRQPDSYTLKYHFDCRNCINGFQLVDLSQGEFYEKFSLPWYEAYPPQTHNTGKYRAMYSTAEIAADDEDIWAALTNFGHHRSGVELVPWKAGEIPRDYSEVLFYYRKLREGDVTSYNQMAQEYWDLQKKLQETKQQCADIKRRQKDKQDAEKVLAIFTRGIEIYDKSGNAGAQGCSSSG